jgi:hypothetical protein
MIANGFDQLNDYFWMEDHGELRSPPHGENIEAEK